MSESNLADNAILTSLMKPFFRKGRTTAFTLPDAFGSQSRVLCIDTGDLSETLFHMPLLAALKERYPATELDFLVPEAHMDLVARSGIARECIVYKEGQLSPWRPAYGSLLKRLGEGEYDVAVVMSFAPQPRLELGALASGARLRLGPSHPECWPAVNFEVRPGEGDGYLGDRIIRSAPFLGFVPDDLRRGWPLPADLLRRAAQQVHFHKPNPDQMLIGIDPGTSKSGHAFAMENILFLVRQLTSQFVCKILPLAAPADQDRRERVETRLAEAPVGLQRESLLDSLVLLAQCDLLLAGNTDFFHFAVAQGVPAVGLFTEAEAPEYLPVGRKGVRVVTVSHGEKVDIETLMEAVEAVTGGRTAMASQVIADPETYEQTRGEEPADPMADGPRDA